MDFVVYGDRWGELPTSATHLFKRVAAQGHRVCWVSTVGRMPRLESSDLKKAGRVLGDLILPRRLRNKQLPDRSEASPADHVAVSAAAMIPQFSPLPRRINRRLLLRYHRRLVQRHDLKNEILVSPFPYVCDLFRDAPARSCYYCYDDWEVYPGFDTRRWMQMEQTMVEHVDGFMGTDLRLMEKCRPGCPRLYLPQGVDFKHFAEPRQQADVIAKLKGPIIGFFGRLLPAWADPDLIGAVAAKFPQANLVLIGKADAAVEGPLSKFPNVIFLGQIPYDNLPEYSQRFSVGLIPYRLSERTRTINPLKLLEYYALGCPVVSTGIEAVKEVGGPVLIGETPEEFANAVGKWLEAPRADARQQARDHAGANSWDARADAFLEFAQELPLPANDAVEASTTSA